MKKRNRFYGLMASCLALLLSVSLYGSPQPAQQLITLHGEVGAVIDLNENARFYLFATEDNFLAAKIYEQAKTSWTAHICGNKNGQSWLIIKSLNTNQKEALEKRIVLVLSQPSGTAPGKPVVKVNVPDELELDIPQQVRLIDNSQLFGSFTNVSAEAAQFKTVSELEISIPDEIIADVRWPKGLVVGEVFQRYDPNNNRLLFGPTGRTLKAGQGDFTDFYVLFPTVAYGFTDFMMVGGGISLVPGASSQLLYIAPKIGLIQKDNLSLAAGFLYMSVPDEDNFGSVYSSLTLGNPIRGVTFGVAVPTNGTDSDFGSPALLFGGETQVSNSVKLLTENWFFTGDNSLLVISGGVRFFGEKLSADIGLFTSPEFFDEGGFPFIPWLDFSVSFGR